jgi:hypothetical protein
MAKSTAPSEDVLPNTLEAIQISSEDALPNTA